MIYVSSSCIKSRNIKEAIETLYSAGIKNIELSGGVEYYDGLLSDLLEWKRAMNLNYLCHNYFPPPKDHFMLNAASLNDDIFNKTLKNIQRSVEFTKKLGSDKFGFHAGYLIDFAVGEAGKKIRRRKLFGREESLERFCCAYRKIEEIAPDIKLYLENNVLSKENFTEYDFTNPFLLTDLNSYFELKKMIDFNLLLDAGHLKVSCNTLNLNFENEFKQLMRLSDYMHLSDNGGTNDDNKTITENSAMWRLLKETDLRDKTITLEIYENIEIIIDLYNKLRETINE